MRTAAGLLILLISMSTHVYAKKMIVKGKDGSVTIDVKKVDEDGKVKSREILRIMKRKMLKLEHEYISKLGRYEWKKAEELLKEIKILLSVLPRNEMISLKEKKDTDADDSGKKKHAAMSSKDFNELLDSVKRKSFSNDKVSTIRTAVEGNKFTIDQLVQLMNLFGRGDSSSKLKVAEAVYPKVVDKKKSYKLYDLFSFRSDKDKLKKIINKK